MGWMDVAQKIITETAHCPICKNYLKKDATYIKKLKTVQLKMQDEVDTQIWENIWNMGSSLLAAVSFGTIELGPIGSEYRQQRWICPKCGRQFVMAGPKFVETVYSKYLKIK